MCLQTRTALVCEAFWPCQCARIWDTPPWHMSAHQTLGRAAQSQGVPGIIAGSASSPRLAVRRSTWRLGDAQGPQGWMVLSLSLAPALRCGTHGCGEGAGEAVPAVGVEILHLIEDTLCNICSSIFSRSLSLCSRISLVLQLMPSWNSDCSSPTSKESLGTVLCLHRETCQRMKYYRAFLCHKQQTPETHL